MIKKTILLTGAGSGIGKETAFKLAARGHRVIATTHTEASKQNLQLAAQSKNINLETFVLDITKESDLSQIKRYEIDVLINAAAIGTSGPLAEVPMEKLRSIFETNVFSTIEITNLALEQMTQRNSGTIIVISSIAGRIPIPFMSPYSMSKFALTGGVAAMRQEVHAVAPNVHVTLIEPGSYHTGFNQKMLEDKYDWLKPTSPYQAIMNDLKKQDKRFALFETQNITSIVKQIISAAETKKPKLRYTAPWYQAWVVQILRIFGK